MLLIKQNLICKLLAVTKHAIHLSSHAFTAMELPIPVINTVSSTLFKNGIDV
ncbi:hypothetical protein K0040_15495 [Terrisporobacter petrolearius]|uniref:hypothetical protein n=1 Tax=Terrisporobacter petrolearius TaxID=1460447 RepID=UPI001D164199|nr:hypothetical protein [Terrisporobacter petrolearius]MCC3865667.1 hypothetical protein [Terrisporobacter petrolearius]